MTDTIPNDPGHGLLVGWTDSHCHLDGTGDSTVVLQRAKARGVGQVVCVGTSLSSSMAGLGIAQSLAGASTAGSPGKELPLVWVTIGLHPHDAISGVDPIRELLADAMSVQSLKKPGAVVAVGECGLDYHYDHSPRPVQREVFAHQVGLANEHDLALVVHSREAWDDTIDILTAEGVPPRTIIHCFTGGVDEARRCLDLGTYISFSGIVTFKNADDLRASAKLVPDDQLLVETDSPFLAPVPHRGEPNEPENVVLVGSYLAQLRNDSEERLAQLTTRNAAVAFQFDI